MKTLKVHEGVNPPAGQEYMATSYPHDGMFLLPSGTVIARFGGCVMCIYGVSADAYSEEVTATAASGPSGVTEDTLLKAIALVQQPQLATVLCGGGK